jgi:hypothetical protein
MYWLGILISLEIVTQESSCIQREWWSCGWEGQPMLGNPCLVRIAKKVQAGLPQFRGKPAWSGQLRLRPISD